MLKFLTLLGVIAGAVAVIRYQWRKSSAQAANQAADAWEDLATALKAKVEELKSENKELVAALEEKTRQLQKTMEMHNECTQEILRMIARLRKHERVINQLERKAGVAVTDFDDPTSHHADVDEIRRVMREQYEKGGDS